RQGGLLALQRRRPLLQLGRRHLELLTLFGEQFAVGGDRPVPLVELFGLLFQLPGVPLELLEPLIDFERLRLKLLLPLVGGGLEAVEADEVGLVLLLALLQGGPLLGDLPLAGLQVMGLRGHLLLEGLLLCRQGAGLLLDQRPLALGTLPQRGDLRLLLVGLLFAGVELLPPELDLRRRLADDALALVQLVAAGVGLLEKLLTQGRQLGAELLQVFLLPGGLPGLLGDLPEFLSHRLLAALEAGLLLLQLPLPVPHLARPRLARVFQLLDLPLPAGALGVEQRPLLRAVAVRLGGGRRRADAHDDVEGAQRDPVAALQVAPGG